MKKAKKTAAKKSGAPDILTAVNDMVEGVLGWDPDETLEAVTDETEDEAPDVEPAPETGSSVRRAGGQPGSTFAAVAPKPEGGAGGSGGGGSAPPTKSEGE